MARKRSAAKSASKRIIVAPYKVGKWKPPVEHRFKPGESGNRRGRPKKPRVGERTLNHFLDEKVSVNSDGREQTFTKRELIFAQMVNRAAKGDDRAIRLVLSWEARDKGEEAKDPLLFDEKLTEELVEELKKDLVRDAARPQGTRRRR